MITPFDPGRKPFSEYAPRELLWGAEAQARAAARELRFLCTDPDFAPETVYVAIDAGDGGSVVVAYSDREAKISGDPSNDLVLLGQTEGFAIALLALKARLGSQAVLA
jgi:hypothetical protein